MEINGTTYNNETPKAVVDILEFNRLTRNDHGPRTRIRVYYGDAESGWDWGERYDVAGHIGRSTGRIKIPLMINNSRSMGGPGLLDNCIVAIRTARKIDGQTIWLYKHPNFKNNTD